jgi:K+-transporting ATPase A subunit
MSILLLVLFAHSICGQNPGGIYGFSSYGVLVAAVLAVFLCPLMIAAARKNYARHLGKMTSLLAPLATGTAQRPAAGADPA